MSNLIDVIIDCDKISSPGYDTTMYFVPCDEIATFPLTVTETTPSSNSATQRKTLAAAITLVSTAGKGFFRKIKVRLNTPVTASTLEGEGGAAGYNNKLDFELADDGVEARVFADELAQMKRCTCGVVALVKDPDTGDFTVVGSAARPAELMTAELTSGDKIGGTARGSKFSISALSKNTPLIYPKALAIDLTPGGS